MLSYDPDDDILPAVSAKYRATNANLKYLRHVLAIPHVHKLRFGKVTHVKTKMQTHE